MAVDDSIFKLKGTIREFIKTLKNIKAIIELLMNVVFVNRRWALCEKKKNINVLD
jgi:hypothetical protein